MGLPPPEIKDVLSYDPNYPGHFIWLIERRRRGGFVKVGDKAGTPKDGYVQIIYTDSNDVRHIFRAHRLAFWWMTGRMPKEVDHIDRNRANNAWSNLREVTRSQNNLNPAQLHPKNVSGKTGVSWVERDGVWLARLTVDGRHIDGRFVDLDEAIAFRRALEIEHVGRLSPT